MGLDADMLMFLAGCKNGGVSFEKTLTIGRQHRLVDVACIKKVMDRIGSHDDSLHKDLLAGKSGQFADEVFKMLGAEQLDSLDCSDFEGANVLHNLNDPLPAELKGQYDAVIDGGTIEHVFFCHEALRNYMKLCKVGGSLMITAPVNNWMGHGFYQLAPDFYYRALSPENGFEVRRMIITAVGPFKRWYEVQDPKVTGERLELISMLRQMVVMVHAVKTGEADIFSNIPQQQSYEKNDYSRMGAKNEASSAADEKKEDKRGSLFPALTRLLGALRTAFVFYTSLTISNRRKFKPVSKWPEPVNTSPATAKDE